MKKLLLASAIAALSVTAAQAAPTVYGKAFLTLDAIDGDYKERTSLNSNYSRIGFKGSEALTANTDLVYQLEYGIEVDSDTQQFKSRDTFLGLSNKQYGTLLAGRLKAIDSHIDYASVGQGKMLGHDTTLASIDGPRANNTFAYVSPSYNGVQFLGMYTLDEDKTDKSVDNLAKELQANDNLAGDAFGVGAKYEPANQPFRGGITYIQASQLGVTGDSAKAVRVSGQYDITPATTVGGLYQHTDFDSNDNENAFAVSAHHKIAQTPWAVYGQLDFVDNVKGAKDAEAFRATVGGKYAFNKNTIGHIYSKYLKEENGNNKTDGYGIATGIEYKF
ncbi:hypothetical protein B0181_01030 [Moraxella caviae]|uniref:Outer membrane porin protein 32 n=1 Tax=Moraxella caviae TaxID=34060 RepID=A0A1T0AB70_9GAMM|nr:porin [Moraxella caviae]OOR92953.1 hypothetical protein B0181_01030 [Moraxella caviae]STZ10082.1 Outer membrane porin protein 32 precursor [Moraxella caviae]